MLDLNGAPGKIRTPNLLIRSQTLYPVELRALGRNRHGTQSATAMGAKVPKLERYGKYYFTRRARKPKPPVCAISMAFWIYPTAIIFFRIIKPAPTPSPCP